MIRVNLTTNGAYWQANWTHAGKRGRRSLGSTKKITKTRALMRCRELELQLERAPQVVEAGTAPRLSVWFDQDAERAQDLDEGTVAYWRQSFDLALEHFGDVRIGSITRDQAFGFAEWLQAEKGYAPATVHKRIGHVRGSLERAQDRDIILGNPFDRVKVSVPTKDVDHPTIELDHLERLMQHAPNDGYRGFWALARLAGLRAGEAIALRWADVDFASSAITVNRGAKVTTKKRQRDVPLRAELASILTELHGRAQDRAEFVCAGVRRDGYNHVTLKTLAKAGLPPWRKVLQAMRANAEWDWQADPGLDFTDVAKFLGHSPEVAMKHYKKVRGSAFARAAGQSDTNLAQTKGSEWVESS